MLRFDHVIMAVQNLDVAGRRLMERFGLASVPGGRHGGHGTGNHIVPLGSAYVELMAVVDPDEAAGSPLGRWVAAQTADGDRLAGWCLRTDDIDSLGERLDLTPQPMTRLRPDGVELTWRLAGLYEALATGVPFFIQWEVPPEHHPARALGDVEADGISWVEVGGDAHRLEEWLGPHDLDIRVVTGPPGIRHVGIGEIVL
jgi:hypothetical protein